MTEEEINTLVISIERLSHYDKKIKQWVIDKLNAAGSIDPEELKELKAQVAELINDSQIEII